MGPSKKLIAHKKTCFGRNPGNNNTMHFTIWEKRLKGETLEIKDVSRIN